MGEPKGHCRDCGFVKCRCVKDDFVEQSQCVDDVKRLRKVLKTAITHVQAHRRNEIEHGAWSEVQDLELLEMMLAYDETKDYV